MFSFKKENLFLNTPYNFKYKTFKIILMKLKKKFGYLKIDIHLIQITLKLYSKMGQREKRKLEIFLNINEENFNFYT